MHIRDFIPHLTPLSPRERIRSAGGALFGILATGLISRAAVGDGAALPALIAPMGASAVLLFAVPASPLAQPWSIIGGNLVAALVGVTVAGLVADPFLGAGIAIGLSIAAMMALRCVHPPSGAVALTAVLGGPAIHGLGYSFVLWPVMANSMLLLAAALAFNNLTGRRYPHVAPAAAAGHGTRDPAPIARVGFSSADLDAALADFDQLLDVDRDDLETILREAELRSLRRRSRQIACAEIMSRDVVTMTAEASLAEALDQLRRHHIKALPVIDAGRRVIGIVTQTDLLDKAAWDWRGPRLGLRHRLRATMRRTRAPAGHVADIMTTPVRVLRPNTPIADVVVLMAAEALHHMPVVDAEGRLVGIVSQTDLIVALLADAAEQGRAAETPAARG